MAEAFDKGRGFTLAVKGRDGEDQAAFLAGERPGAVFVDVEIKPQAKDGRQRQNQRKKRDGSFFQPSSLPTQRNTAARCTRTDSIAENARRHKCFLTEPNRDIPDLLRIYLRHSEERSDVGIRIFSGRNLRKAQNLCVLETDCRASVYTGSQ